MPGDAGEGAVRCRGYGRTVTDDEQVLAGGNSTAVVRIGGAVHRATGPWTPAVHRLVRTLRAAGVREVPEPLGFDAQGREVLRNPRK